MRLLVDTHVFLWWITDAPKMSRLAREAIKDPENEILGCDIRVRISHQA